MTTISEAAGVMPGTSPASSKELIAAIHAQVDAHLTPLLDKQEKAALEAEKMLAAFEKQQQIFDENFERVQTYCNKKLPEVVRKNVEAAAAANIQGVVDRVDFSELHRGLEELSKKLDQVQLEANYTKDKVREIESPFRYFGGQVMGGFFAGFIICAIFYFWVFGKIIDAENEFGSLDVLIDYARWGKQTQNYIAKHYKRKDQINI
jgi:tetrahydromethanopterin S-methyltransferase subunit G